MSVYKPPRDRWPGTVAYIATLAFVAFLLWLTVAY